jgi:hypothetical protein
MLYMKVAICSEIHTNPINTPYARIAGGIYRPSYHCGLKQHIYLKRATKMKSTNKFGYSLTHSLTTRLNSDTLPVSTPEVIICDTKKLCIFSHTVFMCFLLLSQRTTIIILNSNKP